MFGGSRDAYLIRKLNRELMGNIISQQASFYKQNLEKTKTNIYGEEVGGKFYEGPFIFSCLIERGDQNYGSKEYGVSFAREITFAFLKQDLQDGGIFAEPGDIILFEEGYYEIYSTVENEYFLGKNPQYPNEGNPLNDGLENYGDSYSVICKSRYIPADKINISPYKERS